MRRWLLPEHIEDVLPAEARAIERLRRAILDLFEAYGYELVAPPLLEYLEDRKSTRLNSSHKSQSRMPSSA